MDGPSVLARRGASAAPQPRPPAAPADPLVAGRCRRALRPPRLLAETGCEGEGRPEWLRYVCAEVAAARSAGVAVEGICWYPILNHPGWADDRHCHNGCWDYPTPRGGRTLYRPLAREFAAQRVRFGR